MRPFFSLLLLAPLAAGLVRPTVGNAQTIPSPFTYVERSQELGLFTGYLDAQTGRFGFGPSGGWLSGARYAVRLSGPLALEGVLGFASGTRDIINPGRVEGDQIVGEGSVLLTTIDARIRFSVIGNRAWNRLSPFLVFGGGIAFDAAGTPEAEADLEPADVFDFGTSFYGTVGVGSRWFMTETLGLRFDGVFSLWSIDTPPGFSTPPRAFENVEESQWLSGLSFSISLLYRW